MNEKDTKYAMAYAFFAGVGVCVVPAPVLLPCVSRTYIDGLLYGIWSAIVLGALLISFYEMKVESDQSDE